ncbi:MAG: hypothetical protein AAGF54_03010 [Pseudomonadota bacterium]
MGVSYLKSENFWPAGGRHFFKQQSNGVRFFLFLLFFLICDAVFLGKDQLAAQTVTTYTDRATYNAAIPTGSVTTFENFSSVTTNTLMSTLAPGDLFDGFSAVRNGTVSFGTSGFCPQLSDPQTSVPTACIGFNANAPNVPGLVGAYSLTADVVFPLTNEAFSFAFDVIDWNDGFQRSALTLELSNGTNIPVTGPTNITPDSPAAFFGFVLDTASINAGIHIDRIVWTGLDAPGELVGYWDVTTSAPGLVISETGSAPTTALGLNSSIQDVGDTITFTIVVTNNSIASTGAITVSTALAGTMIVCPSSGAAVINNLNLNSSETCTATYTLTQADFDSNGGGDGDVDDLATASFNPGTGVLSVSDGDAVAITTFPDMSVQKTADDVTDVVLGQIITYTYTVTNNGNVTITNIQLDDSHNANGPKVFPNGEILATGGGIPVSGTTSDGGANGNWDSLGPGDIIQFFGQYTVLQADIDQLQ